VLTSRWVLSPVVVVVLLVSLVVYATVCVIGGVVAGVCDVGVVCVGGFVRMYGVDGVGAGVVDYVDVCCVCINDNNVVVDVGVVSVCLRAAVAIYIVVIAGIALDCVWCGYSCVYV